MTHLENFRDTRVRPRTASTRMWEWRVCARLEPEDTRTTSRRRWSEPRVVESHVLTPLTPHSVVIIGDHVRVNALQAIDGDGLEHWRLQAHDAFPLTTPGIASAVRALGIQSDAILRNTNPSVFVVDILCELEVARLLQITRQSLHFRIGGCTVAYEIICAGDEMWQSVQLKNSDPFLVRKTMQSLGVHQQRNVSVTAMLNRIAGLDRMRGELSAGDCGLDLQRIASLAKRAH